MKVSELVKLLQGYPQDMEVAYRCYSEHCLMKASELHVQQHSKPRNDGWIHYKRPGHEAQDYLVFPGN